MSSGYVVGVDVGTGSARAGLFDLQGRRLATASEPITMWRAHSDWAEQSSANIWESIGIVVRQVIQDSGIKPESVLGLSFDATCSLVVLDKEDQPLTVSDTGDNARNVIVWMDHRALAEAEAINAGGYDVLQYVGGKISPEMELPKLKWLKEQCPDTWARSGKFLDLADFLTYRSTGLDVRSTCTNVCKWTYLGHESRWDTAFLEAIGLGDLFEGGRVGEDIRPMGAPIGPLTAGAARHLGLSVITIVGVGIIDAHAGGLGVLGAVWENGADGAPDLAALETALALIGGTSSCHMAVSRAAKFIPGIWGPYFSAMVPDMWLTEGGQSATGSLLDFTLHNHAQWPALQEMAARDKKTVYEVINAEVAKLASDQKLAHASLLTRHTHILDYHLGNRSPIADPRARGTVDGVSLDDSLASLAILYLATIQAVAYGTRHIIDSMNAQGYRIGQIYAVGGGTKNPLWLQEHADITGATIHLPEEQEAVLLGTSILAAVACSAYPDIPSAMAAMCRSSARITPDQSTRAFHDAKFTIYREMYEQQLARRTAMDGV